ncbi:MAG: Ig-like domain-containing protein [Myxococcales bacterium]|nr:Ig-like domain-containing protein [Myxococcales bacterium]
MLKSSKPLVFREENRPALAARALWAPALLFLSIVSIAAGAGCSSEPQLVQIKITAMNPSAIPKGTTTQLSAIGMYADRFTRDLTTEVTWTSLDPAIATVSNTEGRQGLLTALAKGTVAIRARLGDHNGIGTFEVTDPILTGLSVSPANRLIARGTTQQFAATGTFSDLTTRDVTRDAVWTSSDVRVATFSSSPGLATAVEPGLVNITASLGGHSHTVVLGVTNAALVSIGLTPANPSIAKGTTQQLVATGTFSDQTTQDISSLVTWASMDPAVATVSNLPGSKGLVSGVAKGQTRITATLFGQTGSLTFSVTDAVLVGLGITPPNPFLPSGVTESLTATGYFSDGTTQNVTDAANWTSSDSRIVEVSNATGSKGLATAVAPGSARITAALGGKTAAASVAVRDATLSLIGVTPTNPSIARGTTQALVAIGLYSDQSNKDISSLVTWSSSDPTVATISNVAASRGLASGVGRGEAEMSATLAGRSGSTRLRVTDAILVSIAVTPTSPLVARGTTVQFVATGTYSDGSTQDLTNAVTWSSSTAAATISNAAGSHGLATATARGMTTISATLAGKTGSTSLAVSDATLSAIEVTPSDPTLAKGTTVQLVATGTYSDGTVQDISSLVSWTSSDATVAAVSNASGSRGLVSALAAGNAMLTARLGDKIGTTALTVTNATLVSLTVTPPMPVRSKGTQQPFVAIGTFSDKSTQDLTDQVTWASSDAAVATISNAADTKGLATGVAKGTAMISATLGGLTATTRLTVTDAALVHIEISPANATMAKGTTQQLVATGTYSDATSQDITSLVTWQSSDGMVATVSNAVGSKGVVSAVSKGMTTLTATFDGRTGMTTLTVSDADLLALEVTPTSPVLAKGTSQPMTATGRYSDGTTQDLTMLATWESSDAGIASVSNAAGKQGEVTALAKGTTSIRATFGGKTGATQLRVTDATLMRIEVTPANPTLAKGTSLSLVATGTFSDGSTQDLTSLVSWAVTDAAVATVSNALGSKGLATGLSKGTTSIQASFAGQHGAIMLTVSDATLVSIAITPVAPAIARGTSLQLVATGTFSDGSTQTLTTQVTWESSEMNIATVSNTNGSEGLATALDKGQTTIRASLGGITGSTRLNVTDATLASIVVTPANPVVPLGGTVQMVATGIYSDGSKQDLSSAATWTSVDTTVATVSNAVGSKGLATGVARGTTLISATVGGKSDATLLTVD